MIKGLYFKIISKYPGGSTEILKFDWDQRFFIFTKIWIFSPKKQFYTASLERAKTGDLITGPGFPYFHFTGLFV